MSARLESAALAELAPGFAEPVHDAQAVFRVLLEAMSRPGRIQALPATCLSTMGRPQDLAPALAAALLTLLDADTRLWIGESLDSPALRAWIRFHCGASLVAQPELADFALLGAPEARPALLQRLNAGSDVAPQDSATVLMLVDAMAPDQENQRWHGPGIEREHGLDIRGPQPEFWAWRRAQQASFPCGLDFVFAAGDRLVGMPRSTLIAEVL